MFAVNAVIDTYGTWTSFNIPNSHRVGTLDLPFFEGKLLRKTLSGKKF
jgi:hypothetical protein